MISNSNKENNMINKIIFSVIIVLFLMVPGLAAEKNDQAIKDESSLLNTSNELDNYFRSLSRGNCFNGSVLVANDGQVLLQGGYGYANKNTGSECSAWSEYYIASLTKAFTATAVLLLEQDGKLQVTDYLSEHLPIVNTEGYQYLQNLTIEQLLNMSANITDFLVLAFAQGLDISKPHTPDELFALLKNQQANPLNEGAPFAYCNSCYLILGMVIESVSGKTYREFLRERIIEPLNLWNTDYAAGVEGENQRPLGYDAFMCLTCDNNESINFSRLAPTLDPIVAFSAGGLTSTVIDLYRWQMELISGTSLNPASKSKMFTPFKYYDFYYGFGWYIHPYKVAGQPKTLIWHWGSYFGYHGFIAHLKEENITVILQLNFTSAANLPFQLLPIVREAIDIVLRGE